MVCFVKHLVTWLKPCFLPHFLWREQLSLLPNATGCLRGHLSHRNNIYSSENISLARQVGIDQKEHEIIEEAFKIRQKHNDPFDCFIFATARVQGIPLVTEDRIAREFLDDRLVMTWAGLKRNLKA